MEHSRYPMDRRDFLKLGIAAAALAAGGKTGPAFAADERSIRQPPLPYPAGGLAPVISEKTMELHYGRHHRSYVEAANRLIAGTGLEGQTLEQIIRKTADNNSMQPLFNNAAQAWNHAFLWQSMSPHGGGMPSGQMAKRLEQTFGSFENFKKELTAAAVGRFGSGWAWLVEDGGALKVLSTANAGTPLTGGIIPLLAIDVWEHAYYLDYQNRRADYVQAVIEKLLNWDFAAANAAGKPGGA